MAENTVRCNNAVSDFRLFLSKTKLVFNFCQNGPVLVSYFILSRPWSGSTSRPFTLRDPRGCLAQSAQTIPGRWDQLGIIYRSVCSTIHPDLRPGWLALCNTRVFLANMAGVHPMLFQCWASVEDNTIWSPLTRSDAILWGTSVTER